MSATPVTRLNVHGEAREALEFTAEAFGGRAVVRTCGDFGMPAGLPDTEKVVHGQVFGRGGFTYDVAGGGPAPAAGSTRREHGTTITTRSFFLAMQGQDLDEAAGWWAPLQEGATVVEPLAASAWSAGFGMLTDRFGVTWAISVVQDQQA